MSKKQLYVLACALVAGLGGLLFGFDMAVIDWFGRRKLMLVGSIGYIASLATVSIAFYKFGEYFRQAAESGAGDAAAAVGAGDTIVPISIMVFIASHAVG